MAKSIIHLFVILLCQLAASMAISKAGAAESEPKLDFELDELERATKAYPWEAKGTELTLETRQFLESGQGDSLADGPSSNIEDSSSNIGAIAGGAG